MFITWWGPRQENGKNTLPREIFLNTQQERTTYLLQQTKNLDELETKTPFVIGNEHNSYSAVNVLHYLWS